MMRRHHGPLSIGVMAVVLAVANVLPAAAYLKFGVESNGGEVTVKWTALPVRYFVTDRGTTGVTANDFQSAVARAFATWQNVPTSSITYQFAGFTANLPGEDDNRNTL